MSQNPPPLNVIITASDQTRQAVESAKQGFEGLKASAGNLQGLLAGAAAAFAGLTVVGKFNSFVEGAAALDDLAEKTGASVEKLSALAGVAKISGVSLDVVEGSLIRLAKGLAGADEESKGAGNALAFLGLKAEELQQLDTADALKRIADELNKYKDGAGKTALAIDLLGKSGAQALPYLKDLAETQQFSAKITAEQAAQAEQLQKNLNDLATSTGGAWKEFSAGVLPVVDAFVKALLDMQNTTGGLRDEIRRLVADGTLGEWAQTGALAVARLFDALKDTYTVLEQFPKSLVVVGKDIETAFRIIGQVGTTFTPSGARESVDNIQKILAERARFVREANADLERNFRPSDLADRLRAQFAEGAKTATSAKLDPNNYRSTVEKAGRQAKDELAAIENYVTQIREQLVGATEGEFAKMRQKALDVFVKVDFGSLSGADQKRFREAFAEVNSAIDTLEERARSAQWGKALAEQFTQAAQAAEAANAALANFNQATSQQAQDLEFEIAMVGKLASERQKLAAVRRIELDAQRAAAAVPENAPNRDETLASIASVAQEARLRVSELYDTLRTKGRDGFTGLQSASAEYFARITDDAANFSQAFTGIMGALENTFVTFAKTGKFEFKGLVDSIIADIARIVVRQQITAPIANAVNGAIGATGIGGLSGFLGNLFGGANRGVSSGLDLLDLPSFAVGTDYVPRDMIAQIHKGERIVPASQNTGGGEVSIVQNINIDSRSDEATIRQAMLVAKEQAKAEIAASLARNGYGAIAGGMA